MDKCKLKVKENFSVFIKCVSDKVTKKSYFVKVRQFLFLIPSIPFPSQILRGLIKLNSSSACLLVIRLLFYLIPSPIFSRIPPKHLSYPSQLYWLFSRGIDTVEFGMSSTPIHSQRNVKKNGIGASHPRFPVHPRLL